MYECMRRQPLKHLILPNILFSGTFRDSQAKTKQNKTVEAYPSEEYSKAFDDGVSSHKY